MDGFEYILLFGALSGLFVLWRKTAGYDKRLRDMNLRLAEVQSELARQRGGAAPIATAAEPEVASVKAELLADIEPVPTVALARASKAWGGKAETITEPIAEPAPEPAATTSTPPPKGDMEQAIASKWFVWIGGAAIAIGGLLFVKYAHDNGLLPPAFRVIVGLLFGAGLVGFAEYLRRAPLKALGDKTYVPAALSAGGLVIAFGSMFAAYSLYDLIAPQTAFIGMALIALGAIALSLLQGPLIAALGLLGAFGMPTLISSNDPSAASFFPYILIVLAAAIAILRKRDWWWLGYGAIGGALAWVLLWIGGGVFAAEDAWPIGLAALAIGALGASTSWRSNAPMTIALTGLAAAMAGLIALVGQTQHGDAALTLLLIGGLGVVAYAVWKQEVDYAAPCATLAVFATILLWRDASFFTMAMDENGLWQSAPGPGQSGYFFWMLFAGALFGAIGLVLALRLKHPQIWAAMGAGALVLFGFGAWARVPVIIPDATWIIGALAVIAALLATVFLLRKRIDESVANLAMGLLATGATLAALFALDRAFDRVWLTLAIAVLVPVITHGCRALPIRLLGPLAAAVAALAALKLFTAHDLWFGQGGLPLGDHWILYGYGLPAALFYHASRIFNGRYRAALEGGAIALVVSLVSLELRVLIGGGVNVADPGFLEMAAHAMAWLGAGYGLLYRQSLFSNFVSTWGARILIGAGAAIVILSSLIALNPVVTEDALAGGPVFNALLLAYLAPVALIIAMLPKLGAIDWQPIRMPLGVLVLVLLLNYITLETKRLFQGPVMVIEPLTIAENYAYSAVWLVFALALLVAGLTLRRQYVRFAGLGVMILVVLKVFLWDLSDLDGLYRIASFIGLGLCLVGIGFLYTKFAEKGEAA